MDIKYILLAFIVLIVALLCIPNKFDKEILSIQYFGYEDLDISEDVLQKGKYYNFGHFSLYLRQMTIDIESIQGNDKIVWSSPIDQSFLSCAQNVPQTDSHEDSFYVIDDTNYIRKCKQQQITKIKKLSNYSILIEGDFYDCSELEGVDGLPKLGFEAKCLTEQNDQFNRIYFRTRSTPQEQLYGLGEQFSYMNLKGKIFNTLVREKGVGRGDEPITTLANALHNNAGGRYGNSYMPSTVILTTYNRSLYIDTKRYSLWDFQDQWSINILVWDNIIKGQVFKAQDIKKLLTRVTQITGRMKPLPNWIQKGIVVGIQGGTHKLNEVYNQLKQNNVSVAGFWIQDWVGKRWSDGYSRLWWNWELDENHYPNWNQTIQNLKLDGIKVLTYINPMVTDVQYKKHNRNLFREGQEGGYLIHDKENIFQTKAFSNFSAGLLDLTNPKAIIWYKRVIKEEIFDKTGAIGFMADFGEAAPLNNINCSLYDSKISLIDFHQTYALRWHQLVEEAIQEYVKENKIEDEFVFFTRAGYTQSPQYTRLVWAGDQNQNWDRHNGIQSALTAMISAGFSGISIIHGDIGGYAFIKTPFQQYYQITNRTKDLMIRWLELSAFTSVFRSHEGNLPEQAIQLYEKDIIQYTKRNSQLFNLLSNYRINLMNFSYKFGIPVMRALVLEFQQDPNTYDIIDQFMLGSELMVAPVLQSYTFQRKIYFPKIADQYANNHWINAWTQEKIYGCQCYKIIQSPYNYPPAFYKYQSQKADEFQKIFEQIDKFY